MLTFASLIGYAVVYTVFLKRATPQNIVIGGIAGAAPPLLGWAAVTGMPGEWDWPHALLLVLIIFVWTPPHFWALAIFRREDYARALVPMLPVTHGVTYTRWQILFYTVLLVVVTVLPCIVGMSGLFYLGGALVLGAVFLWYAWRLLDPPDEFFADAGVQLFHRLPDGAVRVPAGRPLADAVAAAGIADRIRAGVDRPCRAELVRLYKKSMKGSRAGSALQGGPQRLHAAWPDYFSRYSCQNSIVAAPK